MLILRILFRLFLPITLYDTDPAPPAVPPTPPSDPNAGVQALISRHNNDLMSVVHQLFGENYTLREKNRGLKDQVKGLEEKVPKDGTVVLSKEDAAALESYKALGTPDELKKLQGEFETTKGELGALQKEGILRDVAEATKYKFSVLKTLGAELDFEIKEIEANGKKEKVAHVKLADGQFKQLADYAKENWSDFLPSLQAEPPAQQQPSGTPFPNQSAGGTPPAPANVVGDFIKKANDARAALPNPLAPKT